MSPSAGGIPASSTLDEFRQSLRAYLGPDNADRLRSGHDEWRPATDIRANENRYLLEVELPGIDRDDINISLNDVELTIHCEHLDQENPDRKDCVIRRERHLGGFVRHFRLPRDAQSDKITAHLESGILLVNVPRNDAQGCMRIPVS